MIEALIQILPLLGFSFALGAVLRVADLLHQRELRWFVWAPVAAIGLALLFALLVLNVSHDTLRLFWFAAAGSWVFRGRVLRLAWAAAVIGVVGMVVYDGPALLHDPWASVYFFAALTIGGLLHDRVSAKPASQPVWLRFAFERPHLFWHGVALLYCLIFWDLDPFLWVGASAFVSGYDHFSTPANRRLLRRLGAS